VSAVVNFLNGDGADRAGRTLEQVLLFDDEALERHHDYIQWLFPLTEPSGAVPGSPVLSAADVEVLRGSKTAQANLERAAARMLAFYHDTKHWRVAMDHNHLRITRIIRSLRRLLGDEAADAFHAAIAELAADAPINARSRAFWADA
jgi:hypothetical protein